MSSIDFNGRKFYASRVYDALGIKRYSPEARAGCVSRMKKVKPRADAGEEAALMVFSELATEFKEVANPEAKFVTDMFIAMEDPEVGLYSSYGRYILGGGPLTNKKALVFGKSGGLLEKLHKGGASFKFREGGNESYAVLI